MVIFLIFFVLISGVIGSRIVGGGIVNRDNFAIYGGLGKAAIFGIIAFVLLVRHKGFSAQLSKWRVRQLGWLAVALWLCIVAWMSVGSLLAGERTTQNLVLAHTGLLLSVLFALFGCFGIKNLRLLWRTYRREFVQAGFISAGFYAFLHIVYSLWLPLSSIVLVSVHGMLGLTSIPVELIQPNILVTDKFGITIAEYCSGIESIALFSGLYAIVGLLDRQRLDKKRYLLIFPMALTILFGLNIVRVFGLIAAGYYINAEIAFSLFHSYAGMVFFILYSGIFWTVAYKYMIKHPQDPSDGGDEESEPKHVVISHVYSSDNKGDAALTSVLITDIKRVFPEAEITILRLESVQEGDSFESVPEKPSFMYHVLNRYQNPAAKLLYALYMIPATLLWAWWLRNTSKRAYLPKHLKSIAEIYASADLIIPVGGGYIRSRAGLLNRMNIPLLLHPLYFGHLLRKPTVLYSQSVGPFQNGLERRMVAFVLRKMDKILLREDKSVHTLAKIGVMANVTRAIDSGFLLKGSSRKIRIRKEYKIPASKLLIGVTVRSWLGGEAQTNYEQAVAKALDEITANYKAHVIFIPQVTATKGDDDRITSRKVYSYMEQQKSASVVENTTDHHHIKAMYNELDVLLGTRFHSVIFSLTSYVPVLAIEYEHKTSGIMHDLKLDEWVIPIEKVTSKKLITRLQKLIEERKEYRTLLRKNLPPYEQEALRAADMLVSCYEAARRKQ